jgi:uracil-DNA glycosylase
MKLTTEINLEEVKVKLYEKLKPSGWAHKLKTFILSEDFDKILQALLEDAQRGKRFTPVLKQVFRAFEECPYESTRVVMIGQDPYPHGPQKGGPNHGLPVADGIAFSCSNDGRIQASLKFMFNEIEETVTGPGYSRDPDLKRWSNQGVLLLNTAFTTTVGSVGTHYAIWQPFMAFLLDILIFNRPELIYVFLGNKAKSWADSVPENYVKLFAQHPAAAAHSKLEKWDSGDLFNKINKHLKEPIVW